MQSAYDETDIAARHKYCSSEVASALHSEGAMQMGSSNIDIVVQVFLFQFNLR